MRQFLMAFYVIFFSTGFMGGAALVLLALRLRSRLTAPLLVFQLLFLVGTGLILAYLSAVTSGFVPPEGGGFLGGIMSINIAIWIVVIVIIRRTAPRTRRRWTPAAIAQLFASLVIVKTVANVIVATSGQPLLAEDAWLLSTHLLVAFGMASFGVVLRGPVNPAEPAAIRPLLRAYGIVTIVLAPLGFIEFALQTVGIPWLQDLSLDHFLYLAWNIVSMSAAIRILRPTPDGSNLLEEVPAERIRALGLSPREVEMAVMIGRGLTNMEIAEKLFISPATVRTHIYNLYQKVGAGSRVELLNMLRD